MRAILFVLIALAFAGPDLEKPTALDGNQYSVVMPAYDGAGGSMSYLRLFNAGTSATTFNVTVVNAVNGFSLGTAAITVPKNASIQFPLTAAGGSNSIFSQASIAAQSGSFAIYIQNSDQLTGYQHVAFNSSSTLFENESICSTPMNQQLAATNKQVLTNVHTSVLASYPSTVLVHNYGASSVTVTFTIFDAATGSPLGAFDQTIGPNSTLSLPESQLEALATFHPNASQPHINVLLTNSAGGSLTVRTTQIIQSAQYGGSINMGESCSVNPVPPTVVQVSPSVPTGYCGTFKPPSNYPYPLNTLTYALNITVAPNGRLRGVLFANNGTYVAGDVVTGTVSGNGWSATTAAASSGSGTIQNGVLTGTFSSSYGPATVTATTAACG